MEMHSNAIPSNWVKCRFFDFLFFHLCRRFNAPKKKKPSIKFSVDYFLYTLKIYCIYFIITKKYIIKTGNIYDDIYLYHMQRYKIRVDIVKEYHKF